MRIRLDGERPRNTGAVGASLGCHANQPHQSQEHHTLTLHTERPHNSVRTGQHSGHWVCTVRPAPEWAGVRSAPTRITTPANPAYPAYPAYPAKLDQNIHFADPVT